MTMKLKTGLLGVLLLSTAGSLAGAEMRGLLVFGHEVRSFQLCGDSKVFWISAPGSLHRWLQTEYRGLANRPYEPLYAEIEGEFSEHPVSEFSTDYDGTIVVSEVRSVSGEGIAACRAEQLATAFEPVEVDKAATYVFVSDDQTAYMVRVSGAEAWVFHPKGTLLLPAVPTKTGGRYSDGTFELWIDDQQAQLGEPGSGLHRCRNDRRRAIWEKRHQFLVGSVALTAETFL
jgi:membrane-bound inhibitor of C-type lysozyme